MDIRDPETMAAITGECRPEVVLHLAAQPLVRRSYRDPLGTRKTGVPTDVWPISTSFCAAADDASSREPARTIAPRRGGEIKEGMALTAASG